jgi:hypothetical protein
LGEKNRLIVEWTQAGEHYGVKEDLCERQHRQHRSGPGTLYGPECYRPVQCLFAQEGKRVRFVSGSFALPDLEIEPLEVHVFVCQECWERLVTVLSAAKKLLQP